MTRSIHDIDACPSIDDRRIFRENGNSPLPFEIVGVHNALDVLFAPAQYARIAQHLIDQRCLAVVNVRNDGDISNVHLSTFFLIRKQVIIQPLMGARQEVLRSVCAFLRAVYKNSEISRKNTCKPFFHFDF
ncbi:hypothetical protein SDC9_96210 [bioreactor metagenome]|uniref:Uncharacterized protein n=1 Tax=bioreactor metagenome TaxID=1076179 RepID=A0A645A8I4_9ZZZZ